MESRETGVVRQQPSDWLALECYTSDEVLSGRIRWPVGIRLLDLLNSLYATQHDSSGEFLAFVDISEEDDTAEPHVNKEALEMVTISDANLARGVGAESNPRYPFVRKSPIAVFLRLKKYAVTGTMHLVERQTVQDLLNRDALFLPVTDATILTPESRFYGSRPFIAVNKKNITWVKIEKTA